LRTSVFIRPSPRSAPNLFSDDDFARQRAFFAARPDLQPTPLWSLDSLAASLGIGGLLVKDETSRFGLNAFKAVGTTFAVNTLRERGEIVAGATLVCASEGNHGRAVARAARDANCNARVYMAESVAAARVDAIESEGASIVRVPGTYDDAVRVMVADAHRAGWIIVSDTSWPGYEEIPRLIMLGYTRLLDEAAADWSPGPAPDAIFVQGGVGGLLAAVACWVDRHYPDQRPFIVAVEPTVAACLQTSARHGRPTTLPGPFDTAMGGLRCGEVSPLAFRAVLGLVDAYVAIDDEWADEATRLFATPTDNDVRVLAGISGAAALGGLLAALRDPSATDLRRHLTLASSRVMVFVSEGVTDPDGFARAISRA
jgi:diaminopropionate ammonia-lyase